MDYPNVTHVIQMGLPGDREVYIHRLGRTGRAEKTGKGILLLTQFVEAQFLEQELKGLDLVPNFKLRDLMEKPKRDPTVEELRMKITSSIRSGDAHDLQKDARDMYMSLLGFYLVELRHLKVKDPETTTLDHLCSFYHQLGISKLPILSKKEAKLFNLTDASQNVKTKERWEAGMSFDVGRGETNKSASPDKAPGR